MMEDDRDRYLVPGLLRGLATLKLFTPASQSLSLSQIAKALGITRSAAFRTVYTLTHEGCLLYDERSQSYALGPGVMRLTYGYFATREVVEIAQPELARLRERTGWSVHLGVLDGTSVMYLIRIPGPRHESSIIHVGSRLPARATTLGRVLLAGLDPQEILNRYRPAAATAAPQATGLGVQKVTEILRQAKADAAAEVVSHIGDFEAGIISVAAPVRTMSGQVVAAINVTAPREEGMERQIEEVRTALVATAGRVSRLLGWDPPDPASSCGADAGK